MSEIILGSIILALVATNIYLYSRMMDMSERYMRAFIAKNLTDLTNNDLIKDEKPTPPKQQEFIPVEEADDKTFSKYLKIKQDGGQDELPEI